MGNQRATWHVHRDLEQRTESRKPSAEQCSSPVGAVAGQLVVPFTLLYACTHWLTQCASSALGHQGEKLLKSSRAIHMLNELPRCLFVIPLHFWGVDDATADRTVQRTQWVCCDARRAQQRNLKFAVLVVQPAPPGLERI
jgi:hypothetical protein